MIQTLPSPATEPLPASPSEEMVERIRRLVDRNARRWRRLSVLEALGLAVATPLAYLWLIFALDNLVHLPVWGRLVASLGLLAGAAWPAVGLVHRWRLRHLTEDQVALAMERRTPGGVQNRLINAIQIGRDLRTDHADFSQAVVEENYERLQQFHLRQAAQLRPALLHVSAALVLMAAGLLFWLFLPVYFTNAASRILLPLADIDPVYRTVLIVEPGNIEAKGDITIHVRIRGERPAELTVLRNDRGRRASEPVPVPPDADSVAYTFKAIEQSLTYAVRGGDFTSPFYRIDVPTPSVLSLVRASYSYPDYTHLPEKTVESAGGDLEALQGTRASITFVFDQPAEEAALLIQRVKAATELQRLALERLSPTEYRGDIAFAGVSGYQIETRQANREPYLSIPYTLRILIDQSPRLELRGLERQAETVLDAVLPLEITATDDYGLARVGLFYSRVNQRLAPEPSPKAPTAPTKAPSDDWTPVEVWSGEERLEWKKHYDLSLLTLGAVEGDKLEVALRAVDTDPLKAGRWTTGTAYPLLVGGEGVALQILYEQIVQSEADVKLLLMTQQQLMDKAAEWVRKLEPASGLRWDDPKNLEALTGAMKEHSGAQERLRQATGRVARQMVAPAGHLRLSLGMLADTEMVRAVRILDNVINRETTEAKRAAVADARLTDERTIRSLQELLENYVKFRQEWELAHMVPFTKMLADRQAGLRDESLAQSRQPADRLAALRQASAGRRQAKILELTGMTRAAFTGLVERVHALEPTIAQAFTAAAQALAAADLKAAMSQAADDTGAGKWAQAASQQTRAAEALAAIHAKLRQAQIDAAQRALAALQEKAKSDLEAQKAIAKLQAGTSDTFLNIKDKLQLAEIIHMQEQAQAKDAPPGERKVWDWNFPDSARGMLQQPDRGTRQQFDILKLAKSPTKEPSFPHNSDRKANSVTPHIQEKFDDLVGKLLEEADEMKEKYETYNLNAAFNINEPGEVGKQAGSLNSTAASAATGNQKPPTQNVGGASRSGRRGARAHGMVVGDESVNRRGRDKVQEGQERVGDQAGSIKETKSEDYQKDTSTGVGGKKVESDDNKFSVADTGKWTDDITKRMGAPQEKHSIVERQDGKLDPRVAELMRDLDARHEQLIERIKAIRKELKNLYLPTDHLDQVLADLTANYSSLKERPNPELFRHQQQALDRLRGSVRVFHQAHAGFQPSVPREQVIQGRILDDPARQALPGYEEAVKQYYEKLSNR
jgi:hypothetical protein